MSTDTITSRHHRRWCDHCQTEMVVCGTCGNNACNGGSGKVNGLPCPDCDEAYAHQERLWAGELIDFAPEKENRRV